MGLDEDFSASAAQVRKWTKRPPDSDMLEMYGLYKQGTLGDINIAKPGGLEASAKWNAWNGKKGLSQQNAKEQYIAKGKTLGAKYA